MHGEISEMKKSYYKRIEPADVHVLQKNLKAPCLGQTQMCKRPKTEQNPNEHFLALACRHIRKERPLDFLIFFYSTPSSPPFFFLDLSPTKCNGSSKDFPIMFGVGFVWFFF